MIISELPRLLLALELLGLDAGASVIPDCVIPEKWVERAKLAEAELAEITIDQIGDLTQGDDSVQTKIASLCPNADALLSDAFDGDLSEVCFEAWSDIFDARAEEERVTKKLHGN